MAEFINTIEVVGDEALTDSIIQRTITEFKDMMVRTVGLSAFYGCNKLEIVDLPNVTTLNNSAFRYCSALRSINLPSATSLGDYSFQGCSTLSFVDLPKLNNRLVTYAFDAATSLFCITVRNTSTIVPLGGSNVFRGTPIASGMGFILVPSSLLDSYKTATNWSAYSDRIMAIEDYSVDGTVTGEIPVYAVYNTPNVLLTSTSKAGFRGEPYQASIEITEGYIIDNLSVIMNGVDVTLDVYDSETGVINIPSVTGDVYVSAVTVADPAGITRVPADSAAEGYIPCCKLPVTAGMTIRLEYYLTKMLPC